MIKYIPYISTNHMFDETLETKSLCIPFLYSSAIQPIISLLVTALLQHTDSWCSSELSKDRQSFVQWLIFPFTYSTEQARKYLQDYFDRSQQALDDHQLSLLCIQCFEVN